MPTFMITFRHVINNGHLDRLRADRIEMPDSTTYAANNSALIVMLAQRVPLSVIAWQDDRPILINTASVAAIEVVA